MNINSVLKGHGIGIEKIPKNSGIASETIYASDFVENINGEIFSIYNNETITPELSISELVFDTGSDIKYNDCVRINEKFALVAYTSADTLYIALLEVDGTSVYRRKRVSLDSSSCYYPSVDIIEGTNNFIVAYQKSSALRVIIGTFDTETYSISNGYPTVVYSASSVNSLDIKMLSDTKFACIIGGPYSKYFAGTIDWTDSTISTGTVKTLNSNHVTYPSIAVVDSDTAAVLYKDYTNSYVIICPIKFYNNLTTSKGSDTTLYTTSNTKDLTLTSNPNTCEILMTYSNYNTGIIYRKTGTVDSSTNTINFGNSSSLASLSSMGSFDDQHHISSFEDVFAITYGYTSTSLLCGTFDGSSIVKYSVVPEYSGAYLYMHTCLFDKYTGVVVGRSTGGTGVVKSFSILTYMNYRKLSGIAINNATAGNECKYYDFNALCEKI